MVRSTKEEMVLAEMHVKPGEAWEYCPRSALLRVTKFLQKEFNLVRIFYFMINMIHTYTSNFI